MITGRDPVRSDLVSMDETRSTDELMRRARIWRRLTTATLLLTACCVIGFVAALYGDAGPVWKAATGSACLLSLAAYMAADARREHWFRRLLGSIQRSHEVIGEDPPSR